MFEHPIFDIAIGLVLIYALLSIIVSILIEVWNQYRQSRGKLLVVAIKQLLRDPLNKHYGELLLEHFLIKNLCNPDDRRPPQYISANLFAEALIDIIAQQARHTFVTLELPKVGERGVELCVATDSSERTINERDSAGGEREASVKEVIHRFKLGLESMEPSPLRDALFSMYDKSGQDYDKLKTRLETWYDDYMERVSGWYKRRQGKNALIFGFLVAIGLNVDSLHLLHSLSMDEGLRQELNDMAVRVADDYRALADSSRKEVLVLEALVNAYGPDSLSDTDKLLIRSRIQLEDSLANSYLVRADSVLGILSDLTVPIGWSAQSAPLSWRRSTDSLSVAPAPRQAAGLLAYNQRRNDQWSIWYFVGIAITGIALSTGAPFWFDVLLKLVNIRRAGGKPSASQ
jgi:hypothetical protein